MELIHAFRAAKMVGRPLVGDFLLRVRGHFHPTYGVGEWFLRIGHGVVALMGTRMEMAGIRSRGVVVKIGIAIHVRLIFAPHA